MLKKNFYLVCLLVFGVVFGAFGQTAADSTSIEHNLDELVVTGTRNETSINSLPMTISVVGRAQIENSYQPSLLPILTENVPGLFTTSRGVLGYGVSTGAAGGFSMRGMSGNAQMLVLIDGHPQYMGLFGHPIADSYQSMLAERVEVVRGPASVLYGSNAMGGVVNIITRKMTEDGIKTNIHVGAGSYGTVQTEASSRLKKDHFNAAVSLSYNRTDGHRADMGFEQYGGYVKLGYDFSDKWKLRGDVNVTHFNASNPGEVSEPIYDNDSRITRGMASLMLENSYGATSGALSVFYNWGRHKINDGYHAGEPEQDALFNSKDLMMGVSWYQSASFFTGNRLTVGFDYQHFGGESWNEAIVSGECEPGADKTQDEVAAYVDVRQDIGTLVSLDAGLRVDHHSHVGTEFVPQGGVALHLPHSSELKAMVGKGFRNPTIREMYMFGPQNPELLPEKMINYEISFSQTLLGGAFHYGANVFYIDGDNMIVMNTIDGRPLNVNTGAIENWGLELEAAWRVNDKWCIDANYSWVHMEHPVISAPQHKLYAGIYFNTGRWNVSTGLQYINGLYTSVSEPVATEDFLLWNIRAGFELCRFASLFVRGENLLAQRYEIMAGYPMPKATFMGGVNVHF